MPLQTNENEVDLALVVGIGSYPHLSVPQLDGSLDNAGEMATWLADPSGGAMQSTDVVQLLETAASSSNIEDVFRAVLRATRGPENERGRRFYMYLTGYGRVEDRDKFLFVPSDATPDASKLVRVSEFADYLANAFFDELVFVADCDWKSFHTRSRTARLEVVAVEEAVQARAFLFITNGLDDEPGILTKYFIEGLRGAAADSSGHVTSKSLTTFIQNQPNLHPYIKSSKEEMLVVPKSPKPGEQVSAHAFHDADGGSEFFTAQMHPHIGSVEPSANDAVPGVAPQPAANDWVPALSDAPATVDQLSRRPFAQVIGMRMQEAWAEQSGMNHRGSDDNEPSAFMINIHGPWGSGKTSVLNFLRADLKDTARPSRMEVELKGTTGSPVIDVAGAKTLRQEGARVLLEVSAELDTVQTELRRRHARYLTEPSRPWVVIQFNAWRNQRLNPPWWALLSEIERQAIGQLPLNRSSPLKNSGETYHNAGF
jgi:hypothetical protein